MLNVKNISCQKGYNLLFKKVSFYLKSGEITRITGSNGSGKTSLLKILAGISKPNKGQVFIGKNIINSAKYKKDILYLGHQSLINSNLSAWENLEFLTQLNNADKTNIDYALTAIGLGNYTNELCHQFSAGQKRRVILAILFLSKARVWLLDEPFTALDKEAKKLIKIPIIAIGGINFTNYKKVINSGADSVAMINSLSQTIEL